MVPSLRHDSGAFSCLTEWIAIDDDANQTFSPEDLLKY